MDKQTTGAFVLIGLILVVWLYFNAPEPQPQPTGKSDSTNVVTEADKAEKPEVKEAPKESPIEQAKPDTALVFGKRLDEKIITVETDLARLELTSKGARIKKYFLKKYNTWYHNDVPDSNNWYKKYVQLINYEEDGGDGNLIFVTKEGKLVNTAHVDFQSDAKNYYYKLSGSDSLAIEYVADQDGKEIKKKYVFYGNNYSSKFDIELVNMQDMISSYRYDVVWSNGINFVEKNSTEEARYSKASAYTGGEQEVIDVSGVGETIEKDMNGKVDWVSVRNKYFTVIISPDNPSEDGGAYFEGSHIQNKWGDRKYFSASLKVPYHDKAIQKNSFHIYIGPIDYDILASYQRNYQAVYDFGSFLGMAFLIRPISEYILLPLFKFLHLFIPNYGFVLIVFSIIIKIALHPLTKQSMKSMKKMQLLQPKMKEMKEKYKDDPQKVQKETMNLYKTYGINPAGGCLPMVLQMPILIALWSLFNVAIELRQQPFMLWITNLSAPDVIYNLGFTIPLFGITQITGLAPLLGITMFFQQKMSVQDPSQKAMVYLMPFMFTFMFMGFPSGLNLYYFMFNLLSIVQQQWVNKRKDDIQLVPVDPKKRKSGGWMQRMMDAAEQQKKAQQNPKKKNKKF